MRAGALHRPRRARSLVLLLVGALWLGACATAGHGTHVPVTHFDPRAYYSRQALYVLHGEASYYADSLAGRSTASGEPYTPSEFTAAHRHLPFGTILRVVRRDTGDWVLVRVNDRGPYAGPRRILDVSKAGARQLGILHKGFANVDIEVLELGRKPQRHSPHR
jgi:rare lipoprotein A